MTTEQVADNPMNLNPTGKGGFGDNPQNRNPGGWKKENSFSYQYKRFMAMSVDELEAFAKLPTSQRTVVEDLAFRRVSAAQKSLPDVKEITDRTEGKAAQNIDLTSSDGSMTPTVIIESSYAREPAFRPSNTIPEADELAEDSSRASGSV